MSDWLIAPPWRDYQLLDFGAGQRLERWGSLRLQRPDSWAIGHPDRPLTDWKPTHRFTAQGAYAGRWEPPLPQAWLMTYDSPQGWRLQLEARPTRYKHLGIFPEQAAHWEWLYHELRQFPQSTVLNLFAYTGGASLVAALAGARVTHVDASKPALNWASHHARLHHIQTIRWIHEDTRDFVSRERRRGRRYHAILLDPPAYGIGPQGHRWLLEKDLPPLLEDLAGLLEAEGLLLINTYAGDLSPGTLHRLVRETFRGIRVEKGELALATPSGRALSTGYFLRGRVVL